MKASEALELANSYTERSVQNELNKLLAQIKIRAEKGSKYLQYNYGLSNEVVKELEHLGYKVTHPKISIPFGQEIPAHFRGLEHSIYELNPHVSSAQLIPGEISWKDTHVANNG